MNRNGQVMVAFILLLPLLCLLFIYVVDIGTMYIEKRSVENNVKETIYYGLKQEPLDESVRDKMEQLLRKNVDDITNLEVMVTNNNVKIHLQTHKKTLFSMLLKKYAYDIEVSYQGYVENDKVKIIKE